jgi:hypothetical protein
MFDDYLTISSTQSRSSIQTVSWTDPGHPSVKKALTLTRAGPESIPATCCGFGASSSGFPCLSVCWLTSSLDKTAACFIPRHSESQARRRQKLFVLIVVQLQHRPSLRQRLQLIDCPVLALLFHALCAEEEHWPQQGRVNNLLLLIPFIRRPLTMSALQMLPDVLQRRPVRGKMSEILPT